MMNYVVFSRAKKNTSAGCVNRKSHTIAPRNLDIYRCVETYTGNPARKIRGHHEQCDSSFVPQHAMTQLSILTQTLTGTSRRPRCETRMQAMNANR